jgi:hypothetical protein
MTLDLTAAQSLIDDALTPEEQSLWHAAQRRQKAEELLGLVPNARRISDESARVDDPAAKASLDAALDQTSGYIEIIVRAIEEHVTAESELSAKVPDA